MPIPMCAGPFPCACSFEPVLVVSFLRLGIALSATALVATLPDREAGSTALPSRDGRKAQTDDRLGVPATCF